MYTTFQRFRGTTFTTDTTSLTASSSQPHIQRHAAKLAARCPVFTLSTNGVSTIHSPTSTCYSSRFLFNVERLRCYSVDLFHLTGQLLRIRPCTSSKGIYLPLYITVDPFLSLFYCFPFAPSISWFRRFQPKRSFLPSVSYYCSHSYCLSCFPLNFPRLFPNALSITPTRFSFTFHTSSLSIKDSQMKKTCIFGACDLYDKCQQSRWVS